MKAVMPSPGGFVGPNETIGEAAERELKRRDKLQL